MPVHDYECPTCKRVYEIFVKIKDLDHNLYCDFCHTDKPLKRLMPAPNISMDYAGYNCPVTGKWIEGRRQHEENLKKHGCRVLETGEREEFKKRQVQEDQKFDHMIEETAARAYYNLSEEKKQKLETEIKSGVGTEYSRS